LPRYLQIDIDLEACGVGGAAEACLAELVSRGFT